MIVGRAGSSNTSAKSAGGWSAIHAKFMNPRRFRGESDCRIGVLNLLRSGELQCKLRGVKSAAPLLPEPHVAGRRLLPNVQRRRRPCRVGAQMLDVASGPVGVRHWGIVASDVCASILGPQISCRRYPGAPGTFNGSGNVVTLVVTRPKNLGAFRLTQDEVLIRPSHCEIAVCPHEMTPADSG